MKMKLRTGDTVQVIQGKDIGKRGEVAHVLPDRNMVVVESAEGINVSKKHQKPTRATMQGGIQDKAMPIHASNLMLVCSKDGPVRVGYQLDDDGNKIRVCRKCGAQL
jgi:large subunit ribosomal protein L24